MIDLEGCDLSSGPLPALQFLACAQKLKPDQAQEDVMDVLQKIFEARKKTHQRSFQIKNFFHHEDQPRGAYLYGKVGRGKTMIMDIFFQTLPENMAQRIHFHEFIKTVHAHLNQLRKRNVKADLMQRVADVLVKDIEILCLDEFEVSDITDAMILERLFNALFAKGLIVVMTSNFPPNDLYKDGLQRQSFVPFLGLLKKYCTVISLSSPHDYRRKLLMSSPLWFYPTTSENKEKFKSLFDNLTKGAKAAPSCLEVSGRKISIDFVAGNVAYADFNTLCAQPRGIEDYILLANRFYILLVENIPKLDETLRNEAKRFMMLVDVFYDQGKTILGYGSTVIDKIYSGHSHSFEFSRTVSRLYEMHDPNHLKHCYEVIGERRLKEKAL